MTFWIIGLISVAIILVAAVWLLDTFEDRRPHGVSPADWQQVANEKDEYARRRTLGRATDSRTAAHHRVIR